MSEKEPPAKPHFRAIAPMVRRTNETKARWFVIGAAWKRTDGGLFLRIDGLPFNFDGTILLYPNDPPYADAPLSADVDPQSPPF